MRARDAKAVLLIAALGAGCDTTYPNPFESDEISASVAPSADAALAFTANGYAAAPGGGRELFALPESSASPSRLTFCNDAQPCDTLEAAFARDRQRAVIRRIVADTDGDGRVTRADGAALVYVDLARRVQAVLVDGGQQVTGVDWSPVEDVLVYSARGGAGGGEDLFRTLPVRPTPDNAQGTRNLTCNSNSTNSCDPRVQERRPRIDPSGNFAVFERIGEDGKGQIALFRPNGIGVITSGGPGSEPLFGTPYVVGSDADPDYSPDGAFVVFRRLRATGNGGLGTWDVMTVRVDGSELAVVAGGPAWRGAPDWGAQGIVFAEQDPAGGLIRLVRVAPDGSNSRPLFSVGAGFSIENPRWLPR